MSEFQDFLQYVGEISSIEIVVVGQSGNSLKIFSNTFPNLHTCVLSDLHRHEFKHPHQLIVLNSDMAGHIFFSRLRHQNDYNKLHAALSGQPKFDATVVFLNSPCTKFCLGAIAGRPIIEQLMDCPVAQTNTVPSVWRQMVDNYANHMQQRRLNDVLVHDAAGPNSKKKM